MELEIGGRMVGDGHRCFIIAEVGSNHNQSFELALEHINRAAEAGVDAVKFQTFRAASHYSKKVPEITYMGQTPIYDLIASVEIDRSWHGALKEHCEDRGVVFLSSPCDSDAVRELSELGMAANKIASFDLPDLSLVRQVAETGKPVILSTGMADWMDIQRAVSVCHETGNEKVVLLQCTSLYPAPAALSNLRSVVVMRNAFGVLTGYSDHTLGDHVSVASVALGACVVEKHFTLDRRLPGPDHSFAIEPLELKAMVERIRDIEAAMGDGAKAGPRLEEAEMAEKCRRSLHAAVDIQRGETITQEMLTSKRPGMGIPPHLMDHVVGRRAKVAIEADQWVTWEHL